MIEDGKTTAFSGFLGQQRAKLLLSRSLASGRIAHAYLFRGPDGVGKKLFAAAMARALNCRVSGPERGCGECISCKKHLSGNHPDYIVESPEKGVIKIDRVRELNKSLSYPPYESSRRVVVFEDIHTMRAEAANSLLKTLEEPPEGNVLILTAEASKNILPTISSRCQVIPFFYLSLEETWRILREDNGLGREESSVLARLSEGSPGRALVLQKSAMVEIWQKVISVLAKPKYNSNLHNGVILQLAEEVAELKENLPPFLGLLRLWLRDVLVDNEENQAGAKEVFDKIKAIDMAEQQLARNCNRSLVCEILLFRLQ